MEEIVLSFNPEWYEDIIRGRKRFEYRKNFLKEPCIAYIYLTSPQKIFVSKIWFGKGEKLSSICDKLQDKGDILIRVNNFIEQYGDQYAIPILKIQSIEDISLEEIRKEIPNYIPPRTYSYLKNNEVLYRYLSKVKKERNIIKFDYIKDDYKELCNRQNFFDS